MEGYKGFYKTDNELIVKDILGINRTVDKIYKLDSNLKLEYGKEGCGFHFTDSISKTMPYFTQAIIDDRYKVARIDSCDEVLESDSEKGCFVTRSYRIDKILNHDDVLDEIKNNVTSMEAVRIIGNYLVRMSNEEKEYLLNEYYNIFREYSTNFDENWINIYCLYEAVMYLESESGPNKYNDYYNCSDKYEYTKKILEKI